jgi:hypothetical protein
MAKKGTVQLILEVNGKPAALEYKKLSKQLDELIAEQAELNEETKEYGQKAAEIKKVQAEMDKLTPTIANLNKEKRKLNKELKNMTIGSDEFIKTSERLTKVNARLKDIRKETSGYSKEIKKAEKGTTKMRRGLSNMAKVNPFQLMLGPIGALVGVFGTLIGLFSKSERGAKLMAQATGVINGVISTAVGLVNDFIGVVQDIFTKSENPMRDFGNMIVENIKNRIDGVIKSASQLGKALLKLFKGDFKGAGEAVKEAGKAFVQVATGMDEKKIDEVAKKVRKSAKAHVDLALAKRRSVGAGVALTKAIEQLITKEALLAQKADDATLSFKERTQAAEEAAKASEERAKKEIELAKMQQGLLNAEIQLRKSNGEDINSLLEAQAGAVSAVMAAERDLLLVQQENATRLRQLKQDELERNLDILIDGFDKQKTINERLIASDKLTIDERQKLLKETENLADISFKKQLETIQAFTDGQVNANELINESNADVLKDKIRALGLSEIIEGRLLEIVNERKLAEQDFAEASQDLSDARLEKKKEEAAKDLDLLRKKFEEEKLLEDKKYLKQLENENLNKEERLEAEQAYQDQLTAIEFAYLEKRSEKLKEAGKSDVEVRRQIAEKEIQIAKQQSDKQIEIEARTAEMQKSIRQSAVDFASQSFDLLLGFLAKDEEARKKNASIIKAFEIGKIIANSIAEISSIWKNANSNPANALIPGFGTALAIGQTALASGRAALAVQQIRGQSFYRGGYTGDGFAMDYSTGHRFAGMVHDGEWVAPKWQVESPEYGPIIRFLENSRLNGYVSGGFVAPPTTPSRDSVRSSSDIANQGNSLLSKKMDILIMAVHQLKYIKGVFTYEQLVNILDEGQTSESLGGL